jgi:RNA polymerase sigma-70 factor (ECF subfamily)
MSDSACAVLPQNNLPSFPTFLIPSCLSYKQAPLQSHFPDINQELIASCNRGDRVAQYRLYKLFSNSMYNLCSRMVADKAEAEDLLQEAFVRVFRQLGSFRGECTLGAWIRRIVINQCLNHLRKRKVEITDLDESEVSHLRDEDDEEPAISPELVNGCIRELPEGSRVVFVLFQMEGYKHREIAGMLNISESTSKSQYQRARSMLKEKIMQKVYENQV